LTDTLHIISHCTISNNVVYGNGIPVFENQGVDAVAFLLSAYQFLEVKYPKFYKMDNLSKLGLLASEVLLKDSGISDKYKEQEVGIVLTNSNSSLDADIKYYDQAKTIASPALFVYTLPNIVIGEISIKNKFKGENAFFVFETFDAVFIQQYVAYLLNNNILQTCICGWVDVLKEDYKAVLYLVESAVTETSVPFDIDNLNKIYLSA
jgi:Beta-ketoacyl synthase, N-terminal domain